MTDEPYDSSDVVRQEEAQPVYDRVPSERSGLNQNVKITINLH